MVFSIPRGTMMSTFELACAGESSYLRFPPQTSVLFLRFDEQLEVGLNEGSPLFYRSTSTLECLLVSWGTDIFEGMGIGIAILPSTVLDVTCHCRTLILVTCSLQLLGCEEILQRLARQTSASVSTKIWQILSPKTSRRVYEYHSPSCPTTPKPCDHRGQRYPQESRRGRNK